MVDRSIDEAAAPEAAASEPEAVPASGPVIPAPDILSADPFSADPVLPDPVSVDPVSADSAPAEYVPVDAVLAEPAFADPASEPADGAASFARESEVAEAEVDGAPAETGEDALREAVRRLEAHVSAESERVLREFRDKLAFDGFKEEQVARLHAELQQHREGLLERATRPLLNAVIRVHDDLGKVVASLRARPAEEVTPERAFRALDGFREDLELLLAQHGVEPFEPVDDVFDPRLHTALRTVHTDQPDRTGRIAERLRPGFSHGEALLQKARVAVFTAQGTGAPAARPAPSTAPSSTPTPATGDQG